MSAIAASVSSRIIALCASTRTRSFELGQLRIPPRLVGRHQDQVHPVRRVEGALPNEVIGLQLECIALAIGTPKWLAT